MFIAKQFKTQNLNLLCDNGLFRMKFYPNVVFIEKTTEAETLIEKSPLLTFR